MTVGIDRPRECPFCREEFSSAELLDIHFAAVHEPSIIEDLVEVSEKARAARARLRARAHYRISPAPPEEPAS